MSVLAKRFDDIKTAKPVQLFKSHRDGIADGDQRRDFIYVDDVVRVILWLLRRVTSTAFSTSALARREASGPDRCGFTVRWASRPNIEHIDMPVHRRSIFYAGVCRTAASCRLQWWLPLRLKTPLASMSEIFSINWIAIADRATRYRSQTCLILTRWVEGYGPPNRIVCRGDLMLGMNSSMARFRASLEAPASVLAVKRRNECWRSR